MFFEPPWKYTVYTAQKNTYSYDLPVDKYSVVLQVLLSSNNIVVLLAIQIIKRSSFETC